MKRHHSVFRSRPVLGATVLATTAYLLIAMAGPSSAATHRQARHVGGFVPSRTYLATHQTVSPKLGLGNLTYHGGPTEVKGLHAYAIYWDPPTLQSGQPTTMSSTYESLINRYFGDVGGNALYNNNTQYYMTYKGKTIRIPNSANFAGSYTDTSAFPASDCTDTATPGNCIQDADIQAEVAKVMASQGWTSAPGNMFFVFTAGGEGSCSGSSCAFTAYCAYHGYFSNGTKFPVVYANMPYTGTDLAACGATTATGKPAPNGDPAADSTINVTSHEQMEAVTDPTLTAWYDLAGYEIGDKCAWIFGTVSASGANVSWNGNSYIVQEEWDNHTKSCVLSGP